MSGFTFPFAGMPVWAQYIGDGLPLTHYVRNTIALLALTLLALTIAVTRFRRTLD
jgi:ABC-2 type transport system permease protein